MAVPAFMGAGLRQLDAIVGQWHELAADGIGTRPLAATLRDFAEAWGRVRCPAGSSPAEAALVRATATLPADAANEVRLAAWCRELQALAGGRPFPLGCLVVGRQFGIHGGTACRLLQKLVRRGVLVEIEKGSLAKINKGGRRVRRASEYRYIGSLNLAA